MMRRGNPSPLHHWCEDVALWRRPRYTTRGHPVVRVPPGSRFILTTELLSLFHCLIAPPRLKDSNTTPSWNPLPLPLDSFKGNRASQHNNFGSRLLQKLTNFCKRLTTSEDKRFSKAYLSAGLSLKTTASNSSAPRILHLQVHFAACTVGLPTSITPRMLLSSGGNPRTFNPTTNCRFKTLLVPSPLGSHRLTDGSQYPGRFHSPPPSCASRPSLPRPADACQTLAPPLHFG